MSSKVQICNMALSRLGAATITSLTDGTSNAVLCNTLFNDLADEVMMEGSWTSTIRRVELAQTSTTPEFGFDYEYQLPVDPFCLKVLNVDEDVPGDVEYSIEDDKLLTDESTLKIKYIARLTNTEDWDIFLKRAFIARLASELAYPVTGDARKAEGEFARYMKFLTEGLAMNNQQGSKQRISSIDLTEVR